MTDDKKPTADHASEAIALLRTTQQHHVQLSAMADQKAGFLVGSSVVLLGLVIGNLETSTSVALVMVGLTALAALVLSIIAVIPRYTSAPIRGVKPNTLFFGVFAHIDEDEFIDGYLELLHDNENVRRAMLRDIHQLGTALNNKKFRYLSYAFRVALWGMVVSFGAAIVEFIA
ncbi:MAG: hypothetical protein JRE43_12400 [Deltaproteobacteria bacterium]|jgi:hypothetical protein|nr:hypothetical protein [Deltaproteobacteria bacterium]